MFIAQHEKGLLYKNFLISARKHAAGTREKRLCVALLMSTHNIRGASNEYPQRFHADIRKNIRTFPVEKVPYLEL